MNWSVLVGLLVVQTGYVLCVGPWRRRFTPANGGPVAPVRRGRQALFIAGVLTLGLALASPLDGLVAYLQSMHMVQHMLLTLVAPPLLLMGTPGWLLRPALAWPGVGWLARRVTRARLAFAIGNVFFLLYHVPAIYDLASRVEPLHILGHYGFIVTATIAWWPILGMLPELPGLSRPAQLLYVFLQTLPGALLGMILALAAGPLYETYTTVPRIWNTSVMSDQQISGLIMWIGSNMFWLAVLTAIFFAWSSREEAEELRAAQERATANGHEGARMDERERAARQSV